MGIQSFYPGWRMRIYHNITSDQTLVLNRLCKLYCTFDHVDFCDTRKFASRDVDSWILPRERDAVNEWENKGKQFHVMRDGPFHHTPILAGLWGADNYRNFSR